MIAISYLGLILFIIFTEIVRQKNNKFDLLTFFHIMFTLMLAFPAFLFAASLVEQNGENAAFIKINVYDPQMILSIFIGYFSVLIGFHSQSSKKYAKYLEISWHSKEIIFNIGLFFFLLSTVSILLYTSQFGGVINALSQSTLIRMSLAEGAGSLSFLQHFMFLSYFSSYLFMASIQSKVFNKYKLIIYTFFVVSIINSIIAAMTTGGRANLIYFFLLFYLAYIIKANKVPLVTTITLLFSAILLTLYGKTFFFSLTVIKDGFFAFQEAFLANIDSQPSEGSFFEQLVSNFAFPLYSLQAALNTEYPVRLFMDWLYGIITFIPERIFPIQIPETISTINTEYIAGVTDFEIPTGMFAFGIYSLSWPGLIIVCYVYGWIGRYLETAICRHMSDATWMPFIYVICSKIWIDFFTAGDPRVFLFTDFWALIGNLTLFSVGSQVLITKMHVSKFRNHAKNNF
jgi:oligosaccharide repeat unit polymerase